MCLTVTDVSHRYWCVSPLLMYVSHCYWRISPLLICFTATDVSHCNWYVTPWLMCPTLADVSHRNWCVSLYWCVSPVTDVSRRYWVTSLLLHTFIATTHISWRVAAQFSDSKNVYVFSTKKIHEKYQLIIQNYSPSFDNHIYGDLEYPFFCEIGYSKRNFAPLADLSGKGSERLPTTVNIPQSLTTGRHQRLEKTVNDRAYVSNPDWLKTLTWNAHQNF